MTIKVGYEVLEADDGVGFATPLATLHKRQGWADKFLTTPGDGIEDAHVSVGGKLGPVNKQFTVRAKFASFDTDDSARCGDTDKAWLTLQLKL